MQFDADTPFVHAVTGYGPDGIAIGGQWYADCLLVGSDGLRLTWQVQNPQKRLEAVDLVAVADLAARHAIEPYELVVLGTGGKQIFPDTLWLQPFVQYGIPLEIMSTPAACRTYNIVAAEGRRVLAALWQ